jgi:glucose/arabinose dehydrogenase
MFLCRALAMLPVLLLLLVTPVFGQPQQPDVPCYWRPSTLDKPWIGPQLPCLEEVVPAGDNGELAFTSLAVADDGTLYAARPLAGEVWALADNDGDGLPDTPRLLAGGLTLPNALDWYEGALYVAGGPHVYRIDADGAVAILVDDLPSGPGYWTGGLLVATSPGGPVIFVGTGAACDTCETGDTGRGAVWSFALDGSDARLEATGFRQPADITQMGGEIWVVDSAPDSMFGAPMLDEVNALIPDRDYGFPRCFGKDERPECAGTEPPRIVLPTGSTPLGLNAYPSDTISSLTGSLLVALAGSTGQFELRGYALMQVDTNTGETTVLMPATGSPAPGFETTDDMNYRTVGFYPARPYDVSVSPLGWVYLSLSNGRILAIRPQSEIVY